MLIKQILTQLTSKQNLRFINLCDFTFDFRIQNNIVFLVLLPRLEKVCYCDLCHGFCYNHKSCHFYDCMSLSENLVCDLEE